MNFRPNQLNPLRAPLKWLASAFKLQDARSVPRALAHEAIFPVVDVGQRGMPFGRVEQLKIILTGPVTFTPQKIITRANGVTPPSNGESITVLSASIVSGLAAVQEYSLGIVSELELTPTSPQVFERIVSTSAAVDTLAWEDLHNGRPWFLYPNFNIFLAGLQTGNLTPDDIVVGALENVEVSLYLLYLPADFAPALW